MSREPPVPPPTTLKLLASSRASISNSRIVHCLATPSSNNANHISCHSRSRRFRVLMDATALRLHSVKRPAGRRPVNGPSWSFCTLLTWIYSLLIHSHWPLDKSGDMAASSLLLLSQVSCNVTRGPSKNILTLDLALTIHHLMLCDPCRLWANVTYLSSIAINPGRSSTRHCTLSPPAAK